MKKYKLKITNELVGATIASTVENNTLIVEISADDFPEKSKPTQLFNPFELVKVVINNMAYIGVFKEIKGNDLYLYAYMPVCIDKKTFSCENAFHHMDDIIAIIPATNLEKQKFYESI